MIPTHTRMLGRGVVHETAPFPVPSSSGALNNCNIRAYYFLCTLPNFTRQSVQLSADDGGHSIDS